jgi:hypothetical protein
MKNPTLLIVALISAFASMAQQQPFIQYGYKVKVTTLSNGKYVEHFDQDTIVQIGTVLLNRRTGKIVSFIAHDTTLGEYSLKPELISRWMSPDPLSHEFSSESPYNFGFNNPVRFIDPDGKAPLPFDVILNVSNPNVIGSTLEKRTANMTITLSVVNPGGKADLSNTMFSKKNGSIDLTGTFGGRAIGREMMQGNSVDTDYDITSVTLNYRVVNSLEDVGKNDHVMMLVNEIPEGKYGSSGEKSNPIGLAEIGGRVSAVETGTIGNGSFDHTATHELGHNLGMPDLKNNPTRLMNQGTSGGSVSEREKGLMIGAGSGVPYSPALRHGGSFKASSNYTQSPQNVVNSFLERNKITY